jgi:hypothetical protein
MQQPFRYFSMRLWLDQQQQQLEFQKLLAESAEEKRIKAAVQQLRQQLRAKIKARQQQ